MTRSFFVAGAVALGLAMPALADITVSDAYARAANTKAGAAFMMIENTGETDDRLVEARSEIAHRVELHTHQDMGDGVMRMTHVEEGFVIPAGGSHALARGGDHVMFMGLKQPMAQGDTVSVTLVFEQAGEVALEIPVDLERKPMHGMGHGSGS
ncbi:copper chaperone PCu(A)C [Pseudoponticoccus marisrubri]|uniref:Copper-binding protein n=1 Tax=Pseudoponticoccus marisrubri TaxID=1685382 RepID=A0A0W7WNL7_9RHOB|nr:copper chaperone PCu(A)C [Pseudoponticoccus marisrubri]KUF12189.1 copper-binding protein [Pseudoponticoccus marisrubri]